MKKLNMFRGAWLSLASIFVFVLAATADAQSFQGQATAAKVTVAAPLVTPNVIAVADTGPLPSAGGTISLSSAGTSVAGVLSVSSSNVSTSGAANLALSTASVNSVNVSVLENTVTADFVQAQTTATCPGLVTSGSSSITNLVINGTAITVTGTANQTFPLLGGVGNVVINEHAIQQGVETVNAIHILVTAVDLTVTDIVIASARAGILCGVNPPVDLYGGYGRSVTLRQNLGLPPAIVDAFLTDTGWLPRAGGDISTSTAAAGLSSILTTGASSSSTSGGDPAGTPRRTQSNSHVEQLAINVLSGMVTIDALVVNSDTQCSCDLSSISSCSGSSQLTGLNVNVLGLNVPVVITGLPNQVVNIPVLGFGSVTLTINEQLSSAASNITVNALRVNFNLTGLTASRVVVSSAHSEVVCNLAPTAAGVTISGSVYGREGRTVPGASVTLRDDSGIIWTARTNSFGQFTFSDVRAGQSYVAQVISKQSGYSPRVINVTDNVAGIDFYPAGSEKTEGLDMFRSGPLRRLTKSSPSRKAIH
jgi:hypothetical protein